MNWSLYSPEGARHPITQAAGNQDRKKKERERGRHKEWRERKKAIFYVSQDERWLAWGRPGCGRCGVGDGAKCRKSWAACLATLTNNVLGRKAFLLLPAHFLHSTSRNKFSTQESWARVVAAGSVSYVLITTLISLALFKT